MRGERRGDALKGLVEAVLAVAVATVARFPLDGLLLHRAPYALYFPVVAFVVWRSGLGTGIFTALLGAVSAIFFFVPPYRTLAIANPGDAVSVAMYLVSSGMLLGFGHANRRHQTALREAERALREANAALEARVRERTSELEAKNAELEGFTHAIAHDLRTPLRSIVVNARFVDEDYAEMLGPEGRRRLGRLESASLHVAKLVDDLLEYARAGMRELDRQPLNLSQIFAEELSKAKEEQNAPDVEARIQPDLVAHGDAPLLALALWNLADNAVKYRSPNRPPRVEFGQENGAFYVRDNGIGFDMAYAPKLFRPFERLHTLDEYPGTGIGLANVRRVVERHGGRVWAEGAPEQGTTIWFTL
jgi:signal transduction histidine kinase